MEDTNYVFDPSDFRDQRRRLSDMAFALPGAPYRELDKIDQKTWTTMTSLPDDVSIRTSGNFGRHISVMSTILGEWLPPIPEEALIAHSEGRDYIPPANTAIDDVGLDVYEQLQACRFNALTGYYWIAIACLRGAIELSAIGAYFETARSKSEFDTWYAGSDEVKFGTACDLLPKTAEFSEFERKLKSRSAGLGIFDQKTTAHKGGWARSLYAELSDVVHTRPHVAARHYWDGSNGPVFWPGRSSNVIDTFSKLLRSVAL